MTPVNLLWLRRDLRLHDHAALARASAQPGCIQPVFIFDTEILQRFHTPEDRRLTFIAQTLVLLHAQLKKKGGGLLVLHGSASRIVPKLAGLLECPSVIASEDYEPHTRERDEAVSTALAPRTLGLVKDHLIISPMELTRSGNPYKVFTPYANAWKAKLMPDKEMHYACDQVRYANFMNILERLPNGELQRIDMDNGAEEALDAIGYNYVPSPEWKPEAAQDKLNHFITHTAATYAQTRDTLAEAGTSKLSPYLRFGLLSVRECYQKAVCVPGAQKWVDELIWREFYAMILYFFPESAHTEWNPAYRGLTWSHDIQLLQSWKEGKTGYPVVDAAMRQLLETGWMHNRARMIVASFLTKHLLIDWRLGEEHFAQYLMDYELASNAGGWQWAASTGTDAQPYFRVFNPYLQSSKFDPEGAYIRRYVPELRHLGPKDIHCPPPLLIAGKYALPIVNHAAARTLAIAKFKQLASGSGY